VVQLNRSALIPTRQNRPTVPARYRDASLFVLLATLFGTSFVAIKAGLRELPPVLFASLRFDLGAAALLGYVAVTRPRSAWIPRTRGDLQGIGAAAVFLVVLNNGLLFAGQGTTTPAAASVMYGLNPVLAPLFAWWLLGDRISRAGTVGIGIALAGVVLIVQPSPSTFTGGGAAGQVLVLAAAVAVAFGSVLLQRADSRMGSVPLAAWAMAAGALLLHATSLAVGEPSASLVGISPVTVASILVVGIPSTAVAYAIFFGLIERVGPVRTNLVAYAVPVFAALFGWLLLGAAVSPWTVVGFLVLVVGFALIERDTIQAETRRIRRRIRSEPDSNPCSSPSAVPPCDD
jgi:drug/metabolite transporter (DMT)-like permease